LEDEDVRTTFGGVTMTSAFFKRATNILSVVSIIFVRSYVGVRTIVNVINILRTHFALIFWRLKISNPKHSFVIFLRQNIGKKKRA